MTARGRDGRLSGKVTLVTGAGSGLGLAIARALVDEGARVALVDVHPEGIDEAASALGGPSCAMPIAADVSASDQMDAAVARCVDAFGALDVVVANAGIAGNGDAHDTDEDTWERVIAVNLKGVWCTVKASLPALQKSRGSVVTMASVTGLVGIRGVLPYTAAKGGVIAMTRQLAVTYADHGVRVNAVAPGTTPTPLVTTTYRERFRAAGSEDPDGDVDAGLAAMAERVPLGRLGVPEDVAHAVVFLASEESSWITGAVLPVDGGYTAT